MARLPVQHWAVDGRSVAGSAGSVVAALGIVIFSMHTLGVDWDSAFLPRITTAAMLTFAGAGLVAATRSAHRARTLQVCCGVLVFMIALGCLIERIVDGQMSAMNDGGAVSPLPSVVSFLLVGLALAWHNHPRVLRSYLPTVGVGVIVFTGGSGYALGLRPSDSVLAGMSPTTLLCLAVLTAGLLSLSPQLPPFSWLARRTSGARLALRLVPVMVGLPLVTAAAQARWETATGLPEAAGAAVAVAILGTVLTALTAVSVGVIDRAELNAAQARREVDTAMRESERQFRTLAVAMPAGVVRHDARGAITFANDEAFRIFGLTVDEDLHARAAEMIDPADLARGTEAMRLTMTTGEPYEHEIQIVLRSGEERWVHIRGARQDDEAGQFASYLTMVTDVTERHMYQRQLEHLAHHDPMTGLLNRRAFEARLAEHSSRVARYGEKGAILMIDLDGFKAVNDTLGHAVGDALLTGVAGALRERLRETDIVARLGGDEFAIVLPEERGADAVGVASCLLTLIRENAEALIPTGAGGVSASIGVADFAHGVTSDDMLVRADLAMYAAKTSGKNRVMAHAEVTDAQPERTRSAA